MKKTIIYMMLLAGLTAGFLPLHAQVEWIPILEDYMNGPAINKNQWSQKEQAAINADENVAMFSNDALSFVDGEPGDFLQGGKKLRIAVEHDQFFHEVSGNEFPFRSAMLKSVPRYRHGKFEIRCKTPAGQGYWPSFWLYNDQGPDVNENPTQWEEIDVFEMEGHATDKWISSEHYGSHLTLPNCYYCVSNDERPCYCVQPGGPNPCYLANSSCGVGANPHHLHVGKQYDVDDVPVQYHHNFDEGFHTFTVEWYQNWVYYAIDGVQFRAVYIPYLNAMHLYFGVAVAGWERDENGKFPPYDETTPDLAYMEVDYVKVWAPVECGTKTKCQLQGTVNTSDKHASGENVFLAGPGCDFTLDMGSHNPNHSVNLPYDGAPSQIPFYPNRDQFYATATNAVTIREGFHAEKNTDFHARIVSACSNGKRADAPSDPFADEIPALEKELEPIYIYPNPGTGLFHVNLGSLTPDAVETIRVRDYSGKEIELFKPSAAEFEMDLRSYAKGLYFVTVRTANEVQTYKIVLQ